LKKEPNGKKKRKKAKNRGREGGGKSEMQRQLVVTERTRGVDEKKSQDEGGKKSKARRIFEKEGTLVRGSFMGGRTGPKLEPNLCLLIKQDGKRRGEKEKAAEKIGTEATPQGQPEGKRGNRQGTVGRGEGGQRGTTIKGTNRAHYCAEQT